MKKILPILLILFITGCQKLKEPFADLSIVIVEERDFPCKAPLVGNVILTKDHNKNLAVTILDTLLLVTVDGLPEKFHLYHKNSEEFLGSLGVKGKGPNEWGIVFHSDQSEITSEGIFLWFSDESKGRLFKVNLTKTLASGSPLPIIEDEIKVDAGKFPFNQLIYLNASRIVGTGGYYEVDRARVKSYNPQTEEVKKSGLFPTIENPNKLPAFVLYNFYHAPILKHPSSELIVQPMSVFNRIDIFDGNLNLVKSIVAGENWQDGYYDGAKIDLESNFMTDIFLGYESSCVTSEFIFAIMSEKEKDVKTGLVRESKIKVFDWEGNPKCLITVPDNLFSISVDEKEGFLYATDIDNEKVLRYDLQKLMAEWKASDI